MPPRTIRSILGLPPSIPSLHDSVLVIIDAQNEYLNGTLRVNNINTSLKVIYSLLERYRNAGGHVIHVVHEFPPPTPIYTKNTPLAEIVDELKPLSTEPVIYKSHASVFTDTPFLEKLREIGKSKLVLVGYMAHNCISATARAGAELGFDISVVHDAIGDRELPGVSAEELVRVSLLELSDVVATIINSTAVKDN
ncbi:isochorismatase family protein [Xylogone sp. PMI_703]|nr:isochorismatase family protein [Xylogone sp. PMI_703]